VTATETHQAIDAVWHIESAKVIAGLTRIVRDLGLAEDLAQDALVAALEQWPSDGIPRNPGAWLMATAKHRAIDRLRRNTRLARKHQELAYELERERDDSTANLERAMDDEVEDDLLRLIFTACHPVLPADARVALTLRVLGGLSTEEIARAFLVAEATMAQRLVRAKRVLAKAKVPFEIPVGEERTARLESVLEVIYLIFNEGYMATAGDDLMRPALCDEALRVGRVLAGLTPDEAEVHGLVALMEIQASRTRARTGRGGEPIVLLEQNRGLWNQLLIRRGLAALERAEKLAVRRGRYVLQAAIAACHARAGTAEATDWTRIAALYRELATVVPSPVVELNRAMAVAMAEGPHAGLALVDALAAEPALASYAMLPAARGHLLVELGRLSEARPEFEKAAALTGNARERTLLLDRAAQCVQSSERNNEEDRPGLIL
jgi:RNA polymerase sigma factor (sigma-70 family)